MSTASGTGGARHTVHHVRGSHAGELRAVVDNALARAHERVELHRAVEVDDADARERGLGAVRPDADHLAVDREVLARSAGCVRSMSKGIACAGDRWRTHSVWAGVKVQAPAIILRSAFRDSPFFLSGSARSPSSAGSSSATTAETGEGRVGPPVLSSFRRLAGAWPPSADAARRFLPLLLEEPDEMVCKTRR